MRWLLVCATAAAFVTPPPRLRPLATTCRVGAPRRTQPLAGKTRALQETNTNSPWHDKGDDFRKALKEFQAKVTKWVLVVAARERLGVSHRQNLPERWVGLRRRRPQRGGLQRPGRLGGEVLVCAGADR